jgi:hypothetical protein
MANAALLAAEASMIHSNSTQSTIYRHMIYKFDKTQKQTVTDIITKSFENGFVEDATVKTRIEHMFSFEVCFMAWLIAGMTLGLFWFMFCTSARASTDLMDQAFVFCVIIGTGFAIAVGRIFKDETNDTGISITEANNMIYVDFNTNYINPLDVQILIDKLPKSEGSQERVVRD